MPDTPLPVSELDARRRRMLFRANHRGMLEMDIVLGGFARREIASLAEAELDEFEEILEVHDNELVRWITREQPIPEARDTPLMRRIVGSTAQGGVRAS